MSDSQSKISDCLRNTFSEARLSPYSSASDTIQESCQKYFWNLDLCEALYPVLHAVEISVRNEMDRCISEFRNNEWWFQDNELMGDYERETVLNVEQRLKNGSVSTPTRNHYIADLSMGFWVALFHKFYERSLWPDLLTSRSPRKPFRNAPKKLRTRKEFYLRLDDLRKLRNRVFHHEPIWNRNNLSKQYETALNVVGWVEPELKNLLRDYSRFSEVHGSGWQVHSRCPTALA